MNVPRANDSNFPLFLKFSALSFAFYRKSLTSLAMTLVIPLGFLLVSSFTYYANIGSPPITIGMSKSVSKSLLAQVERAKIPGLQIVPIEGSGTNNIREGKVKLVLSQTDGEKLPIIYTLEQNKAIADVVATTLSADLSPLPAYEVIITRNDKSSFAFLPGLLIMSLMNLALFTTGAKLLHDRSSGTLRLFRLFPVPLYVFFSAETATKLLLALAQSILFILLGDFLLELHLSMETVLNSVLVSCLCALSLLSFGIALGSNLRSYSSGIHMFTIFNLLMIFMGDLMFPNSTFPATRAFSFLLPATHCVNLLRQTMLDYPASFSTTASISYLLIFTILMWAWTLKGFRYTAEE